MLILLFLVFFRLDLVIFKNCLVAILLHVELIVVGCFLRIFVTLILFNAVFNFLLLTFVYLVSIALQIANIFSFV